jgi:GDP-L-fucose synthase
MDHNSKIYIAGHTGLVGSSLIRNLQAQGYNNLAYRTFEELDLTNQQATAEFFQTEKPEYVILAAAKVGGIQANNTYPAQFIYENLQIQNNIIHQAYLNGVKKLLFLGSVCIYPKFAPEPVKEEYLLTGKLEPTNEPYALAKIAGIKMCQSYNRQYGTNFISVMPANLYGLHDNFDLEKSHVIPAMIRKFHEAKIKGDKEVVLWGTGTPRREFLHVDDMAEGCIFLINNFNPTKEQNEKGKIFFNLGAGEDINIKDLAELIKKTVGYEGDIVWDKSKPDGTLGRLMDSSKVNNLGWNPNFELKEGLKSAFQWYVDNYK